MSWVFLSPHFDDAALSCGGLAWMLAQAGSKVSIWTVCAGEVPAGKLSPFAEALHDRWETGQDAPAQRKQEDLSACERLGAVCRWFSIPDCIYRRDPATGEFMYTSEVALNGELQYGDTLLIKSLHKEMEDALDTVDVLICPLALGNHVDHQLARLAAEGLRRQLWYYADFPYILQHRDALEQMEFNGWGSKIYPISPEGLKAWTESIAAYDSQISTFWKDKGEMVQAVAGYMNHEGGIRLWRKG